MESLPPLRVLMAEHKLVASRAMGQNFLFDEHLLDRIAAVPGRLDAMTVFEVGPGPGGLTRALLRAGARVVAIERDNRFLPLLGAIADHHPGKLSILSGDALKIDLEQACLPSSMFPGDVPSRRTQTTLPCLRSATQSEVSSDFHIIANLPYNIGTALLTRWLEPARWPPPWRSLTLMFQREVAERIVAHHNTSAYGRLSILSQWRSTAQIVMHIHRAAFTPPPKVMSSLVHIVPLRSLQNSDPTLPARLSKLTAHGFGQRRKMLRQSLKKIAGALDALEEIGIDSSRRAETLAVKEWVLLARKLGATS